MQQKCKIIVEMKLFTFWIEYYCVGFLIEELNSRFQGRGQVEMHFKVFYCTVIYIFVSINGLDEYINWFMLC